MALLSDDQDIFESYFRIETGGNGDYYPQISYVDEDNQIHVIGMRVAMSGGNAPTEVKLAVMGVMECSRNNCNKVMCDTYIDDIGYLCMDCQNEFKDYLESKDLTGTLPEGILRRELKVFMKTEKDSYLGNELGVDEFFQKHTR